MALDLAKMVLEIWKNPKPIQFYMLNIFGFYNYPQKSSHMDTFVLHTGHFAEKPYAFQNKKSNNLSILQHMNMKLQFVVWLICATAILLPGGNDAKVLSNFMGKYYIKCFSFFIPPIHHPSKNLNRLSKTMHSTDHAVWKA